MEVNNVLFNQFLEDANKGNPIAQYNVGICYYTGDLIEQNYQKAVEWFRKSSK
ncbi:MAG: SEL1-like repeat protein, partial [Clostridia bacterium]|nr:SEL1-like repeat protein [Clostridia bacterium]